MKKFLAVLLALTLVLAFAACGGDDKEESKVSSVDASVDASVEESVDASVEESADASVEESVDSSVEESTDASVEESVDASVEESSAEEVEVITTAEKTNYALNKTYEAIRNGGEECVYLTDSAYCVGDYSDDGTKLTDGKVAAVEEMDPSYLCTDGITVQYCGTGASYDVYFDLEACYGDINSIVFRNVRNGEPYGDNRGISDLFFVYTSNDNVNWTRVALEDAIRTEVEGAPEIKGVNTGDNLVNQCVDVTLNFSEAATGKYVRVNFSSNGITASCPDGVYIVQLDEIEIWN